MDTSKFEFKETDNALAELSEILAKLGSTVNAKKNELRTQKKQESALLKDREDRLEILRSTSTNILHNLDHMITRLDEALENDGTSNNNN